MMKRGISPVWIGTFMLAACSGKLASVSTTDGGSNEEPDGDTRGGGSGVGGAAGRMASGAGGTVFGSGGMVIGAGGAVAGAGGTFAGAGGTFAGAGGAVSDGGVSTHNCGFVILTQMCPPGATFAKCKSCSGFPACHGKDSPSNVGLDLTADGIGDGTKYIDYPADDSVMGSCGAGAMPTPMKGKVYIDPINPENSLLYQKETTSFVCGSRMPFASTVFLSDTDQRCILDWIKSVPGVRSSL
jgi:hypothetical protein